MSFNWEVYRELNPDLEKAGLITRQDFESHYLVHGRNEGRNINIYQAYPDFKPDIYKNNYPDLQHMNNQELEIHWIVYGRNENRTYNNTVFDTIDKILYINLDYRKDRKNVIIEQFKRIRIPLEKIVRISAVYDNPGYLGCTQSHIKCLEYAINNNLKNVLILEDDFNFIDNISLVNSSINNIKNLNNNWNVLCFSSNINESKSYNNIFNRALDVQTASGYMVNSNYYLKLLNNYKESLILLKETDLYTTYGLDQYWKQLQRTDIWLLFKINIGYQRESFSDIEKKVVKYNC